MPALATVLSNTLNSTWEKTPSVARTMNFSFIVRDNSVGAGQTASDLMKVTVSAATGPFSVTSQNTATTWTAGTNQTITWNVANTNTGAVNTPSVNIFLSTNGGYLYPITLATNVLNNGSAVIVVPSVTTTTGRIMVRGAGNIFYDLNNAALTIVNGTAAAPISNFSVTSSNLCTTSITQLTDQSLNAPTSWTWTATSGTGVTFSNVNAQNPTVTFANAGTYTISLIAKNATGQNTSSKTVTVNATPTVAANSSTICSGNATALIASGATTYNWNTGATTTSISVSPTTNTNYSVTGTTNGCSNTKVTSVTVKATPTVAANSSTICSGNTTALIASGATTYSWNTGATTTSISVSPTTNTNYSVTGTTNGCSNTKVASVTVNALPNVIFNAISGPLCVNNSSIALSGSPTGGIFSGVGVNGDAFDPFISGAGTFTLNYEYIDANLCSALASQTVGVDLCTGIKEIKDDSFIVFPNPTNGNFSIDFKSNTIEHASIEIYDAIGKLVLIEKITNTNTIISFEHFSKGFYFVRVKNKGDYFTTRIIKQ
jgi:PKD repeat protein